MPQVSETKAIHRDLKVVHATPGRIRLKARKLHGRSEPAEAIVHQLSGIQGMKQVDVNQTTGSLTMHYHRSALQSVTFFGEVAAALGLIAEGIDPSTVESMFELVGFSPADLAKTLDSQHIVLPVATFALGFILGRHLI
jgi:Heavy metal associated domain 2